jgi:hypothetical protein
VCRNLADFESDLPSGIPQDLVDDILRSLVNHSALNATTLGRLRRCELQKLPLATSRGVSDEWLVALNKKDSSEYTECMTPDSKNCRDSEDEDIISTGSWSSTSFHSAVSSAPLSSNKYDTLKSSDGPKSSFMIENFSTSATSKIMLLDLRGSQKLTDRGLLQLKDLSFVEVARFDNCTSITGRGLITLSNSNSLHTLSLSNCRCLTDEAIVNISHLSSIIALSLDGCRCLTDVSLEAISQFLNLKKLDLSQCDLITDEGLRYLWHLEGIEELSLGWCRSLSDDGVDILTSQPGRADVLLNLCLARCNISDRAVEYIERLQALRDLDLNGCTRIGSLALSSTLEKLKNISSLNVSYCPGIL